MAIELAERAAQRKFRQLNDVRRIIECDRLPTAQPGMNLNPHPPTVDHKTVEIVGVLLVTPNLLIDQAFGIRWR
jgi:hypothetical protein